MSFDKKYILQRLGIKNLNALTEKFSYFQSMHLQIKTNKKKC